MSRIRIGFGSQAQTNAKLGRIQSKMTEANELQGCRFREALLCSQAIQSSALGKINIEHKRAQSCN